MFIQSIKDGIFRDYIIKKRFPYTQIRITVKKKNLKIKNRLLLKRRNGGQRNEDYILKLLFFLLIN